MLWDLGNKKGSKGEAETISFTASLARRYRLNSQDDEALEHDRFMNEVLEQVRPLFK